MAGTIRGKIDCLTQASDANDRAHEIWKGWWDHMQNLVTAGVCTLISSNFGDGGTGFDYLDGGNPFGSGAFGVYRFAANGGRAQDFYLLGQYGEGTATTAGDPILVNGSTSPSSNGVVSFAVASALASDGTTPASPWLGTTNANGTDTKGSTPGVGPVWGAPVGGTLAVWPISNNDGFSHGTNKENTVWVHLNSLTGNDTRFGFITDDDNFFVYVDLGNDADTDEWFWFGPHTWATGLSPAPLYDLGMVRDEAGLSGDFTYGDTTGTSALQGGLYSMFENGMRGHAMGWNFSTVNSNCQPSNLRGGSAVYEEFPINTNFQSSPNSKGTAGTLDPFIKVILGVVDSDTKTDLTRIVLGDNSLVTTNITVPWNGVTTPRSTLTRGGVEF